MMQEEYYAARGHILTCNKNKSLKCMRFLNGERERERASNSNHQSSTPTETYLMHKSHFAMLLILRKKAT
jgi:hypothetical protein